MITKDSVEGTKTGTVCTQSHKPAWWTDSLETSWGKVKVETLRDWRALAEDGKKVGYSMDEAALAFGHGAREIYTKLQVWGGALEDTLKVDWKETGHEVGCAWTRVRTAVKHGWERAGGHGEPIAPKDAEKARPGAAGAPDRRA
jgi:hypothetical protein